ncbi:putative amidoligase enzyme-domain-containing protein [Hypoxylon sp. FL1284]|nr:putative amidoligase enzyme-domain-containing protein [Hypoxylon sp. FL1284]
MASTHFKLQVGTRHSVGIELEFLVAYLHVGEQDPLESNTNLPPLLRLGNDTQGWDARMEVIRHIRGTLRNHGIDVAEPMEEDLRPDVPMQLRNGDKWSVSYDESVREKFCDDYGWVPVEVRTPAFWAKEESYDEIRYVVNMLKYYYRLRLNPTCGLHVHVGNGRRFFSANTVKRLAAFLWAADPTLSRLHAPWRRVHQYCPSIRHISRLACGPRGPRNIDRPVEVPYPIPVTEFSDTSLEEREYAGREGWQTAAELFSQTGPYMAYGVAADDVHDYEGTQPRRRVGRDWGKQDNLHVPMVRTNSDPEAPFQINDGDPDLMVAAKELLNRLLAQAIPSRDQRPEEHSLHRNLAWSRWDEQLEERVRQLLLEHCQREFGHRDLRRLAIEDQVVAMLSAQSTFLFGHADVDALDMDQQAALLQRCEAYVEATRSSFQRNPETNRWELAWWTVGPLLRHPNARREIAVDAPRVVRKFEDLAALTEVDGEAAEHGFEYVGRAEHDEAFESVAGLEKMFDGLRGYVESPGPDFKDELPPGPLEEGWTPLPPPLPAQAPGWRRARRTSRDDLVHPPKLQPHDPRALPPGYREGVDRYLGLPDALWERIDWLPSTAHPQQQDPAATAARTRALEEATWCIPQSPTAPSAAAGVAQLLGRDCDSAVAAATLLQSAGQFRANYNFDHYGQAPVAAGFAASPTPRTVEFREAGGSLDANWIVALARIYVGVVRFARRAPAPDFLAVLDRLRDQEDRDLARRAARAAAAGGEGAYYGGDEDEDEAARYDVCDLLEDLGLFVEAAVVRRRERTRERDWLDSVR